MSLLNHFRQWCATLAILTTGALTVHAQWEGKLIIDYDTQTRDFTDLSFLLGTDIFYSAGFLGGNTIVANIESGHIWFGHEAFLRPPDATSEFVQFNNPNALNELDYHATMVGHVLAGSGYVAGSDPPEFFFVGLGMAPYASVWSGSIATEFSTDSLGSFQISTASTITAYKAFFEGIAGEQPDVINSSWGGSDPNASTAETLAIDGLARNNPNVAFVVSAGNSGAATVSGPGTSFNGITVGSVGGTNLRDISDFSSRGAADFFNPATGTTTTGVRAAVDIVAPGENLVLAAYLGDSGSLGASTDPAIVAIVSDPSPADLYFTSVSGTSFSAPIVAGGVALLKDVAKSPAYSGTLGTEALDTRVIKSVLMAGAEATVGWNNGQTVDGMGVTKTTQALDFAAGAGAIDLTNAASIYVSGTTNVTGSSGGNIAATGWDFAALGAGATNNYLFSNPFDQPVELTVSLNWFAGRTFTVDSTDATDPGEGTDLWFADLNLQVWRYVDGAKEDLVAESATIYNNSEFLRLTLADPGQYGLSIFFNEWVYNLESETTSETYSVAWRTEAVPEPSSATLLVFGISLLIRRRRRR